MKGAIEGRQTVEYESKLKISKRTKIYDAFILKNIKGGRSVKVCDFCCGTGVNIELLNSKVGEIVGVDVSKDMVRICKLKFKNNRKVKLKITSVTNTGLKSNYFDYVLIRLGLHHVKDKKNVICEAYRLLKPKGKLLVIDKSYLSLLELYEKAIRKLIFKRSSSVFQEYNAPKKVYEQLFSSDKFRLINKKTLPYEKEYIGKTFMCVLQKV